jgi:type II secretion system protein C
MELLLRRYVGITELLGITMGAALMGHGVATRLAGPPPLPAVWAPRRSLGTAPAAEKSVDAIVGRGLFGAAVPAATPLPELARRPLTLLAIMFAPSPADRRWSAAIVRDDETATTAPYSVGAGLGGATVDAIEAVRVVLDYGQGRREILELLHRAPPAAGGRVASVAPLADGIRKTGAHSYEVGRAVIDQVLEGRTRLPRIVPQAREGRPAGLRLLDVGRDGPFAALGLHDGDLLLEVNELSLATPDSALAAYAALRNARQVALVVLRDGERIRTDYVVR